MRQALFNLNTGGPDDERFTTHMKDLILTATPLVAFGSLAAILTPFVEHRIHEVTTSMACLEDMEVK